MRYAVPTPLHTLVQQVRLERSAFRRVHRLIDAFEWAIKWHTALAVSDVLVRSSVSPRMKLLLSAGLRSPSLGLWHRFFREACADLPQPFVPYDRWERLNALEQRHHIVALRNTYAHGATPPEDVCATDADAFEPVLHELIGSALFTEIQLLCADDTGSVLLQGEHAERVDRPCEPGHAYALRSDGEALDLWPLGLYVRPTDARTTPGTDWTFFYFNALRQSQIEQLNYEFAILQRDRDLWEPFHERIPLKAWSLEAAHGLDHLRAEIETLTESFKGRHEERRAIKTFCLDGRGSLLVWGAPGIGKSALLAQTLNEIKSGFGPDDALGTEYPPVAEYYIRKDWHTEKEDAFTRSVAAFLDDTYPLPHMLAGSTPDERAQRLRARLALIDAMEEPRRSVLFVDGLDENPDLLPLIPTPRRWLAVVLASRQVAVVEAWYRGWCRDAARRSKINVEPLTPPDVRALLYDVADKYQEAFTDTYVLEVAHRSEGNPMFLRLLCDGIFDAGGRLRPLETIPRNVRDMYEETIQRVTRKGMNEDATQLLYLLSESTAALDQETIGAILGINAIRARAAVGAVRELLAETPAGLGAESYQFFHQSLRQWLRASHGAACAQMRRHLVAWSSDWARMADPAAKRFAIEHATEYAFAARGDSTPDLGRPHLQRLLTTDFIDEKLRHGLDFTVPTDTERLIHLATDCALDEELVEWLVAVAERHPALEVALHWGVGAAVRSASSDRTIDPMVAALDRRRSPVALAMALHVAATACVTDRDTDDHARFAFLLTHLRSDHPPTRRVATAAVTRVVLHDTSTYTPLLPAFRLRELVLPGRAPGGLRQLNGVVEVAFRVLGHRSNVTDARVHDAFIEYAANSGLGTTLVRAPHAVRAIAARVFAAFAKQQFKYAIGIEGDSSLFASGADDTREALHHLVEVLMGRADVHEPSLIACLNAPTPLAWMTAMAAAVALASEDEATFLRLAHDASNAAGFAIGTFRGSGDVVPFRSMNLVKMLTHCRPATAHHVDVLRDRMDRWIDTSPETCFMDPNESIALDNEYAPFAPLLITECRLQASDDLTPLPSVTQYSRTFHDQPERLRRLYADLRKPAHYAPQRVLGSLQWCSANVDAATSDEVRSGLSLAFWFVHAQHPSLANEFIRDHPHLHELVMSAPGEQLSKVIFASAAAEAWELFLTRHLYETKGFRQFVGDLLQQVLRNPSVSAGIAAIIDRLGVLLAERRSR